jgi:AraC-like DNA-binding protein
MVLFEQRSRAIYLMRSKEITEKPYLDEIDEPVYSAVESLTIVELLAQQGISNRAALQGIGIRGGDLHDPQARVSGRQRIALYRNAKRLSNDPAIGIRVGSRLHLSSYGIYGFALLSSSNLGSAVEFAFKYLKLAGPLMEKTFRLESECAVFEAKDTLNLDDALPMALEIWFGSVVSMLRDTIGRDFRPDHIQLSYPEPEYVDQYKAAWGCEISFNAPACRLEFDSSTLDQPLMQSSEITFKLCQPVCQKLLAEFDGHANLSQNLQQWMLQSPGAVPPLRAAAQHFGFNSRTLRRNLAAEGTSFRELRRQVRETLAVEYLKNTDLTTAEIAERIGFSDAANFRSAFRRWKDLTPTAYRSKVAAHGPDKLLALSWGSPGKSLA